MSLNLKSTTEQKVLVKLAPKTASGHDAKVDGKPVWTVTSGDATVEPSEDGLSAYLVSADTAGKATWTVEADADLGEGVTTITDGGEYEYTDPLAENLGATADEPVTK